LNVVLVVDVTKLKDKEIFNKHLKKEGFVPIKGEPFAYNGEAHTHLFNTRAYILEVVSKALGKTYFDSCKIMFQIGDNPMEVYVYNKEKNDFLEISA